MKRIIHFVLAAALFLSMTCVTVGCRSRAEQLKMYVPGEYIDEEIFEDFEEWYHDVTGKTVEVVTPTTFDTVEDVLTAVEHDHADFDLLLPSDYAVERLIKKGLVRKLDPEIIDVNGGTLLGEEVEDGIFRDEYRERAKISDPTLEYSVPYMYGTFGIMYDYSKTGEHISSWSAIFTDEYKGKSANKGSLREAMTSAAIWAKRDVLAGLEGEDLQQKLQKEVYEDFSQEGVDAAVKVLREMTGYSALWGGEDLKFNMATGMTDVEVALMWSCDAGYVMNEYEDDEGNVHEGNKDLWYVIPDEGGNIYLDSFVISKYAQNPTAANYFLAFLCGASYDADDPEADPEEHIAVRNSWYAGAVSPVRTAYEYLNATYEEEYNDGSEWGKMYMETMFPSEETLYRCGTMRDYGDRDGAITLEWVYAYVG